MAYARLGVIRDKMRPSDVEVVQRFLSGEEAVPTVVEPGERTTQVLDDLQSALGMMLTFFGMDEDENSKSVFDAARQAYRYAQIVLRPIEPHEREALSNLRATVSQWHETAVARGFDGVAALLDSVTEPSRVEPAPGWCKHCQQYTIDEPLPSSADADWLRRVAVLAGVWPAHDESNCPAAILTAIEKYHTAMVAATPPRAALTDEHPYTYASTQATNCAGCGEYKHTPLRIDAMDGYVCLTCIDKKLGTLLGEFGCPAPQSPLSEEDITSEYFASQLTTKDSVESVFAAGVRWAEKAHGIARAVIAADRAAQ